MTCGLRQAGIDVIAGVDLDENAKETYEYNNPGSVFVHKDVKRLHSNYFEKNSNSPLYCAHIIPGGHIEGYYRVKKANLKRVEEQVIQFVSSSKLAIGKVLNNQPGSAWQGLHTEVFARHVKNSSSIAKNKRL